MRKALSWAVCVALAALVGLAIAALAEDARTPTEVPTSASSTSPPEVTREPPRHGSIEPSAAPVSGSPTSAGSCANEGWRVYSKPRFPNQKSCEIWVRKHVVSSPATGSPSPDKKPGSTEVRTAIPFLA